MSTRSHALQLALSCTLLAAPVLTAPAVLNAQATAPASANTTQRGTVKTVSPPTLTMTTDDKVDVTVTPSATAKILQLAPGSTDPKTASPATLADIAPGDRILTIGKPGETPATVNAVRIYLMKSSDIATLHASQSADWQRRGTGGLVKGVEGNSISVSNGAKLLTVATTPNTIYRRYAGDSVKFEDAKPSTLGAIRPGDQVRVRGAKSDDGATVTAEEVVSGSFQNLAGALSKVDPAAGTVTLKDLATKQTFTILVTPNSDLRHLPAQAAAAFARSHAPAASGTPAPRDSTPAPDQAAGRRAGMDLSQLLARLPAQPLAELKPGDAVLVVASTSNGTVTAVTMLSGVEQILSASPGAVAPTLSPWNLGSGAEAEGGAGGGAPGGGVR